MRRTQVFENSFRTEKLISSRRLLHVIFFKIELLVAGVSAKWFNLKSTSNDARLLLAFPRQAYTAITTTTESTIT